MRFKLIILICLGVLSIQKSRAQMYVKDIFHEKIPIPYTGKPLDAYEYKDKNGLHIYLVTKTEKEQPENKITIVGCVYTLVNGNYVKDWSITDFSGLDVLFKYTYTKIVDIDNDGVYETIFVYELDPNDGEGSTWKLMFHYKNQKYALRVHIPALDEDKYTEKFDKTYDTLPAPVKKYVVAYWDSIANEQMFKGGAIDLQ